MSAFSSSSHSLRLFYFYLWHVYTSAGMHVRYPERPGEGIRPLGADVTGNCELPTVGARN